MQSNKGAAFFLRIAGVLLLITAIVAGLLAVVNQFTEKKIEENEQKQISDSIGALYEGSIEKQTLDLSCGEAVVGAYRVYSDGAEAGVCFHVETNGYGGVIGMMVGFDTSGAVCGVNILQISETAGLGSRVNDAGYLAQYKGSAEAKNIGQIDVLTGATVSSKAVMNGVNSAIEAYSVYGGEGNE